MGYIYTMIITILFLSVGKVLSDFSCFTVISGTLCRNETACSFAGFCDGINLACPLPSPKSNRTTCRNVKGPCDTTEYCNGIDITCPTDKFLPEGTICIINNNNNNIFNNRGKCDGAGPVCLILNIKRDFTSYIKPKRDFAYAIKCGNKAYFCGIETLDEITFKKNKVLIFGGTSIGPVSSVSIFDWPECLRSRTPLKCPNGNRTSIILTAECKTTISQRTWVVLQKTTIDDDISFPSHLLKPKTKLEAAPSLALALTSKHGGDDNHHRGDDDENDDHHRGDNDDHRRGNNDDYHRGDDDDHHHGDDDDDHHHDDDDDVGFAHTSSGRSPDHAPIPTSDTFRPLLTKTNLSTQSFSFSSKNKNNTNPLSHISKSPGIRKRLNVILFFVFSIIILSQSFKF
jgi:hypothetical protein